MKNTFTFYFFDSYKRSFIRLAIVESPGLCNLLLPKLSELYPDNLYRVEGSGKREIPQVFDKDGYSTIILPRVG